MFVRWISLTPRRTSRSVTSCEAWLEENLPKFLADWGGDEDLLLAAAPAARRRASPAARSDARTGSAAQRGPVGGDQLAQGLGRARGHAGPERHLRRGERRACGAGHLQRQRHLADRSHDHQVGHPRAEAAMAARHPRRRPSTGARASASPRPAPTSPTCARPRSATATSTSSTARRSGSRPRTSPTGACSCCAPTPTAIERGAKHEGITAFIVNMHTPGIECRPIRDIAGDELLQRGLVHRRA